jgi:integrase
MSLTNVAVRNAKPAEKQYKLTDGRGMYLLIRPSGGRYWRLDYRYGGKRRTLALGTFPAVSLKEARRRCDEARQSLADGVDPLAIKQAAKRPNEDSFEALAREWHGKQKARWTEDHARRVLHSLEVDVFPDLAKRSAAEITAPELLSVLRKIERRGAHETRSKVMQRCGMVFRYGIATGRCTYNPAGDLKGAFTKPKPQSHAALSAADLPEFMHRLARYEGFRQNKLGLELLMLTFVRTGELRGARWNEFTFEGDAPTWCIPAERMKMGAEHLVPLARQAVDILRELQVLNGHYPLVFPGQRKPDKPISENTLLYALYRMGYHSRATGHGFRATASTILNEQGWRADVIERQLAHAERNKIRAAYNRAEYLPERRQMMQAWADYLDGLRIGANVVGIRRAEI